MNIILYSLARRGAMVHYHVELANFLSKITRVHVITSMEVPKGSFASTVRHYQINTGRKKVGTILNVLNPSVYFELNSIIKKVNPDIIHMTAPQEWNPVVGSFFRFFHKLPLVYTVFDPTAHEGTPYYFKVAEDFARKIPDAFIVQTQWLKNDFVSKGYSPEKTFIVQLGAYSSITQWQTEDLPEKNEILFFGRFDKYKGFDLLLDASSIILEQLPDWKIIIAGRGDFRPYAHRITSERIEVINKFIEDKDAAKLFQQAKIVVLPYISATSTGVIPLAYAFSKPVVATNVGSLGDVVDHGKTGLLVPPGSVRSFSEAVISISENESKRKQLAHNALIYSKEKLNWQVFAKAHMKIYQYVIDSNQTKNL